MVARRGVTISHMSFVVLISCWTNLGKGRDVGAACVNGERNLICREVSRERRRAMA